MARIILYTAFVVLVFGFAQAQLLGGFNRVATENHQSLINKVNTLTFADELIGAFLTDIKCADSQVVAGANYIVNGVFQQGSEQKVCIVKLSEDLQGNLQITSVDCKTPSSC